MARMVRLTVEYDMDDMDKPLSEELRDWIEDRVTVFDVWSLDPASVKLTPID